MPLFARAIEFKAAGDISGYFANIMSIHALNHDQVEAGIYDPMIVEWPLIFTPIEYEAWFHIRSLNMPMFPQFPVGRFFVDFGDPWAKLAIECDVKQWHNQERDKARDAELANDGWAVIRLTGADLWRDVEDARSARHDIENLAHFTRIAPRHESA